VIGNDRIGSYRIQLPYDHDGPRKVWFLQESKKYMYNIGIKCLTSGCTITNDPRTYVSTKQPSLKPRLLVSTNWNEVTVYMYDTFFMMLNVILICLETILSNWLVLSFIMYNVQDYSFLYIIKLFTTLYVKISMLLTCVNTCMTAW
jgi:hypothetical protein